jgi:hypothetical protein
MQIYIGHPPEREVPNFDRLGGILTSPHLLRSHPQGVFLGSANVPAAEPLVVSKEEHLLPGGARVAYGKRLRRMTLQRYLVSQVAYKEEEVTFGTVLVMYDNLLWCQDKSEKDPHFQQKFGQSLTTLAELLKGMRFHPSSFRYTIKRLAAKIRADLGDFIYPKRNLPGIELHVKGHFQVLPHRESGTPRKQLPERRRIGVGYRDKGHRRDPAWDGSPSWQEVAQSVLP